MIVRLRWTLLSTMVAAVLLLVGAASRTQAQSNQSQEAQLLRHLKGHGAHVYRHAETGEVRFIGVSKKDAIKRPVGLSANASPEAAARAHLAKYGKLFGLRDEAGELHAERTYEVGKGRSLVRFQQAYKGVPVLGGQLNVEVAGSNDLLAATGEVLPGISLGVEPAVSAQEAKDAALEKIAKQYNEETSDLRATEPGLWIYDPALLGGPGERVPRLVWRMDITPEGLDDFRELVLVDAARGTVALNFDQIEDARNRKTYTTRNTTNLPGSLVCGESNDTCSNGDTHAKKAHQYARDTYDFYKSRHNRDSIDGRGMPLISTVHYGQNYQNAFWNGKQMIYGDGAGFALADDVVGHEFTHGVTDSESQLFYYYQSGAINESLSDVWGEYIDLTNGAGNDTAAARWKLGENITGWGAIRDMKNPPLFDQPDRMGSALYEADWFQEDAGGVHTNSGVNNKAAYLMTDGGIFNGKTVTGLGITKVAKIYYRVQRLFLTSGSDYQDLHAALQQSCRDLIGTSNITAANCQEVKDAVDATEMNQQSPNAPAPEAPVCPAGQTATNLFSDGMENTASGNWTKITNLGTNPWQYDTGYASSGQRMLWGPDQEGRGDYSMAKASGVTVPVGKTTYLRFSHSYDFEADYVLGTAYDGGVLEYSTNNGASWFDAGPLIVDNGYDGSIDSADNPLDGRQAFVGTSFGYRSSRIDLSSLAGQSVRFRFRIGTDSFVGAVGWVVDDVRVYTCT